MCRQEARALKRSHLAIGLVLLAVIVLIAMDALKPAQGPGAGGQGSTSLKKAPDFTLTDIYGHKFSLSDFRGKVVILDFFTTYCVPCKAQVSELKEVKARFGDKLVIISISVYPGDTDDVLREYAAENGIDWLVARDTAGLANTYNIKAVPTLVVVDPDGYIRARHVGLTDSDTLAKEVKAALGS